MASKYLKQQKIWLKSDLVSAKDKAILSKMKEEDINVAFGRPLEFGTAGVRGKMLPGTSHMNEFTYAWLTAGFAKHLLKKWIGKKMISVIIFHDNRINSDKFAMICANVFTSFGISVKLFENNDIMNTPMISYTIPREKCQAGIIITASHNPKEDNGYKAYKETGSQILEEESSSILSFANEIENPLDFEFVPNKRLISYIDKSLIEKYINDALKFRINTKLPFKKTKVVYTAQHGGGSAVMPLLLEKAGYHVISVKEQNIPRGDFRDTKSSNPEDPISFELAIKCAEKNKAKLILATDPDADRLGIAIKKNNEWIYMTGNEMGTIFLHYLTKHSKLGKRPYVVSSYVSTNLIDRIAKKYKIQVYRTSIGFKWMGNKIDEVNKNRTFLVAFEEAIGALNSTLNRDKDGFQAALLACEIWTMYQEKGMDFVDILEQEIFPEYGHWQGGTISITFKESNWRELASIRMKKLEKYADNFILDREIKSITFNKIANALEWNLEDDSYIKFRMSGTEPKFKIYFNLYGESTEAIRQEKKELLKAINALIA